MAKKTPDPVEKPVATPTARKPSNVKAKPRIVAPEAHPDSGEGSTKANSPDQVNEIVTCKPKVTKPKPTVKSKAESGKKVKPESKAKQEDAPKRPHGRPTKFTEAIATEICERISTGETLREICRDNHMPSYGAVYDWRETDAEFSSRLARAREKGEEAIAQDCLAIADDATNDWMEKFDADGGAIGYQLNGEHVQRSKLRIETRLKLLKIWNPAKYGEKVDVNHGVQPENPMAKLFEQIAGTSIKPAGPKK